jgi:hypothetical protein
MMTGERTPLKKDVGSNPSASTGGKCDLADGGHYWTINLATKAVTNAAERETSFVDVSPTARRRNG